MRQLSKIKESMTAHFVGSEEVRTIYSLNPVNTFEQEFSKFSLENILFDIIAFAIWTLEGLFDIFRNHINALIVANKHGKLEWYINTALNYQHGFEIDNFGDYLNGSASPEDISASKIIANVAFEKAVINGHGVIRAKAVKLEGDDYAQLTRPELAAFDAYINKKTLFGLAVLSISRAHDDLKVKMKIWYDPMVIDSTGARLDGTDAAPVLTAINEYLKSVEFNGEFVGTRMVDAIQKVQGVSIPKLLNAYASPATRVVGSQLEMTGYQVEEIYQTFAGYMKLDVAGSTFEYIARE